MPLQRNFESLGSHFFRYRSYYPLLLIPLLLQGWRSLHFAGQEPALEGVWLSVCIVISLLGLAVRVVTIGYAPRGTSGRNTRRQLAQVLSTTGTYSLTRHPLYFGNYLIMLGIFLYFRDAWMIVLMTCLFTLFYERIIFTEEAFLKGRFGREFEDWARKTPPFLPRFASWRRPECAFRWRMAVKREYSGLFAICLTFFILKIAGDFRLDGNARFTGPWLILPLAGALVYVVIRTLTKTGRLDPAGPD